MPAGRASIQIIYNKDSGTMRSVWANARYDASEYGTKLLESLIPGAGFTYPKSLWTVYDCVLAATETCKDALVIDFFAGSSTTAHAVMKLNADDGGNRRVIMVQAPQSCDVDSVPARAGFHTIADISKERIRCAGKALLAEAVASNWRRDVGFRVLKVDSSNMADVYYAPEQTQQQQLALSADNIKSDRTGEDLLFQVLLDWGVDLALPIERRNVLGRTVFLVDGNALVACFETGVDEALVRELAKQRPLRAVFRDGGYASDSTKINVEQIFKLLSPETEVRSL